jgi:hypothetical protein
MRRIRRHLTYSNVMVTILAFIVLTGGTAVALNGSNTVQSDDLGPGSQVKAPDVAANAVNGSDVAFNSLTGEDISENSLDRVRYSVTSVIGGKGRSSPGFGTCDPDGGASVTCAEVTVDPPDSSNILLTGQATALAENSAGPGGGACQISAPGYGTEDGSTASVSVRAIEGSFVHVGRMTTSTVWGPFPAGSQTFRLTCSESLNVRYVQARITAVALYGG